MRPPLPSMMLSRRAKIALSVVGILIVLLIVLVNLAGVYVNYLWFGEVGHRNVYSTVLWTKVVLFVVFGLLMALILGGNLLAAYLIRPPFRPMSPEQQNLQNYVLMIEPRRKLVLASVMVIAFLAAGASAQGDWAAWQLFLHGDSFGTKDAQFGKDVSFYAFDYPVYRLLLGFGFTAVIFAIILSVGVHYLSGAIRLQTPGPKMTIAARRHITVLVFVFMAFKAAAYWLDRYGLVFSDRSVFTGASYTDVHSLLPAKTILFWITIILALGVLASMWLRSAVLPGIGFVVLIVLSILISGIYPSIVQHFSVKPNASDKEARYIERNINATREAYGIVINSSKTKGPITRTTYPVTSTPLTSLINPDIATVANLRITDPNVVSPTIANTQTIKSQIYGFADKFDVDRYDIDGVTKDYVVGVREANPANLTASNSRNWINEHTVYTHGYGLVAAVADQDITLQNAPYAEGDIPQTPSSGPLYVAKPQVYYGQLMTDYSIVGAKGTPRERDGNLENPITYDGSGGISLSSPLTKLAFAVDYKETNFLLNDAVGADGARVIINRDPKARVAKIAPFLTVDGDPYPVADTKTGHIVWMVDAYTTMANFPYSERQSLSDLTHTSLRKDQKDTQINYIRNSVKATVDAYDGTVHLYDWDTKDPVLKAWMNVFPGLVLPKSDMPSELMSHVRYPQDLFDVQRALLAQYHVDNPITFYNGSDRWQVPSDPFNPAAGEQPPYYVLANPPTTPDTVNQTPQFQLTSTMLVNNSKYLAAYISANCDPDNYGTISVLTATDKQSVEGPPQVASVFRTNSVISSDLSILGRGESTVVHGNLLTLPLGNSFLYVEPLYLVSSGGFPTLQRVIVRYGGNTGYGKTLAAALLDITQPRSTGSSIPDTTGNVSTPTPTPSSSPPSGSSSTGPSGGGSSTPATTEIQVLAQLATAESEMDAAYASKDPVALAQAQQKINDLVKKLIALHPSGGASTTAK